MPEISANGTVIIAEEQTKGRGRQGKSWDSSPGKNLTFSILLFPKVRQPEELFDFSVVTANAVCESLQLFIPATEILIKWPNDIFANGKKIAGILTENVWQGKNLTKTVIGIGLNVNEDFFDNKNATSMCLISGKKFDREEILHSICHHFEKKLTLAESGFIQFERNLFRNSLYCRNKVCTFEISGKLTVAIPRDVLPDGKICLEMCDSSEIKTFDLNELKWVFSNF